MRITLEPTAGFQHVCGVKCRVWTGETDAGVPIKAWIPCVEPQTLDEDQLAVFEASLKRVHYHRQLVVSGDHVEEALDGE